MNQNESQIKQSKPQQTGFGRNTIDKFYTKSDVAKDCLEIFQRKIEYTIEDIWIEPSAGNGSFSKIMKEKFDKVYSYDIDPEEENIIQQDFLTLNFEPFQMKKVHIIGNPPFGRQSVRAKEFIQKSCQFASSISFILPKSFKKDSFQKSFDSYFHLIYEKDLPSNSFLVEQEEYDVPCVFQIWHKKDERRKTIKKVEPKYFQFVKKEDKPDFSFRRVGVYAGKIDCNITDKSIQSHYFIQLNPQVDKHLFIEKYKELKFEHNNTVGPKSISKQEMISKINQLTF
jgi:predicted RNA methylase